MPPRPQRLTQRFKRLRHFLPAIALAVPAAFIDHPLALVPLLLAQPLYLAGAVSCLGYLLDADFGTLTLRRAPVALVFFMAYALVVAGLVGAPAAMLVASASPLGAALVSLGVVLSVVVLWRVWAAFGFAFLWDDAYPESTHGSWILTAVRRIASFAHHAAAERDPWFGHGNLAALALALVTACALALVGLAPLVPDEIRTALGLGYAVVVAPLAHLVIAWRSEWLLIEEPAQAAVAVDVQPAVDPVDAPLVTNDPVRRDVEFRRAVVENRIDTALALLAAGASGNPPADPRDPDQRSVVAVAATLPDLRLLRALILKGADLNASVAGLTPLLAATRDSYNGRPEAVMTLLTNGARAQQADVDGNTPLHGAALTREATIAAMLVDAGADPNAVNREGLTPLGVAAGAGNEVLVRFLLEHGARPDAPRALPALIAACAGTDDTPALVKLLLKHKAPLDARDRLGRSALHAAALHGHAAMAEALLAAGAAVDARDANGVTPLMEAARAGANRVLQRLVFRKPDVAAVDQAGRNALMLACLSRNANEETARTLLALAPDVAAATPDGRRAVDFAVAAGRWPLVRLIDPSYELPTALTDDDDADAGAASVDVDGEPLDRPALLLRALRLGRTDMAAELLALVPPLGEAELLPLAHACLALDAAEPLRWLLRHGVSADARDGLGQPLLVHGLGVRPLPRSTIAVLRAAAAPVGGTGLLEPLVDAADDGEADLEAIACEFVAAGACAGGRDRHGRSLLQAAVRLGWTGMVQALLERGADPNAADPRGRTPMHELAQLPDAAACTLADRLLAAGGDPERAGCDGQTPLGAALATGRGGLIARLSWAGGYRHPGRRLRPADLPAAAACGDLGAVERLLGLGVPLDGRDPQGCTALLRASGGGHLAVVDALLARGADARVAAHTGATPLSAAISARRDAVVERLLAVGVDPDQRLAGGATALLVAAALGNESAIGQLLRRRADPAARDDTDGNALHAAAQFAFASADGDRAQRVLDALLAAGTPADARNRSGQTPLLLLLGARVQPGTPCPQRQLPQLVRVLVAAGADVGAADERGVGVLHACAMHGLIDAAAELKRAGADLDQRDRLGRSAHDVALMLGYVDVAAALRRGAPTRAVDPRAGRG